MNPRAGHRSAPLTRIIYSLIFLTLLLSDQMTKFAVRKFFLPGESVSVIPGLLSWTYIRNRGAAFGMMNGQFLILTMVPLLVCLVMLILVYSRKLDQGTSICLLMISAGGLGNVIDRFILGYVTDMIDVSFFPPIFNVADCFVTVGCVLLVIVVMLPEFQKKK